MSKSFIMRKFSRKERLIWGITSLGGSMISGVYGALLQYFYHVYLSLGASWIVIAVTLYAVWNAFNDPLFGLWSDKTRSKKGRRIPFMRYSAPFLGLSFILVFLVPAGIGEIGIFIWMIISMFLYDTFYTIIFLVYSALLPELTEDDNERGALQTYASILGLIGLAIGFILPDMLRPKVGDVSLLPLYIGVTTIGIIGALFTLITSYSVKERPEYIQVDIPLGLKDSLKYTFKSKSFLLLTSANFMSIFMQQILISNAYYLADYVMKIPGVILFVCIIVGLLCGTFVANLIAKKLGVVKANQILLLVACVPLVLMSFAEGFLIFLLLFFAGFGLSGPLVLTNILFAQVCDEDEVRTGVRREAAFFGVNALITKPAQSIALALGPWLMTVSGFLISEPGQPIIIDQPASALFVIKSLVGLIPGIAVLIGAIILIWYPLRGDYLKEIQKKCIDMHVEKEAKLKQKLVTSESKG